MTLVSKRIFLSVIAALTAMTMTGGMAAWAAEGGDAVIHKQDWTFSGIVGHFDRAQLRRGYTVYKGVCAACHGMNARGGAQFNAPDIRGADEARVRSALTGVAQMSQIRLSDAEIAAVVVHLQELNKQ